MPEMPIDYGAYREIDLTLVTRRDAGMITDIHSRSSIQVGSSTHLIQEIDLRLPRFALPLKKGDRTRRIPREAWRDPLLTGQIMALLIDSLQKSVHGLPVHAHEYAPRLG